MNLHDLLVDGIELTLEQRRHYDVRIVTDKRYAELEHDLNALEDDAVRLLAEGVVAIADAVLEDIASRFESRSAKWVADYQLARTGPVQMAFRDSLRMTYEMGSQHADEEVRTLAQEYARRFPRPQVSDRAAIEYLEAKAVAASRKLVDRIDAEVKTILLNAIRSGEPKQATIDKLSDMFASYGGRPAAYPGTGGVPPSLAQIRTIMRTTMTDAYNHGRLVKFINARNVKGVFYSAVLDGRTTEICARLNGHIVPIDHDRLSELVPPNHFNCRSILLPVRRSEPMLNLVSEELFNEIATLKAKVGWS